MRVKMDVYAQHEEREPSLSFRPHMEMWLHLIFKLFNSGTSCLNRSFISITAKEPPSAVSLVCNTPRSNTASHLVIGTNHTKSLESKLTDCESVSPHLSYYTRKHTSTVFGWHSGINPPCDLQISYNFSAIHFHLKDEGNHNTKIDLNNLPPHPHHWAI